MKLHEIPNTQSCLNQEKNVITLLLPLRFIEHDYQVNIMQPDTLVYCQITAKLLTLSLNSLLCSGGSKHHCALKLWLLVQQLTRVYHRFTRIPIKTPARLCGHRFCQQKWRQQSDGRSVSTAYYCSSTNMEGFCMVVCFICGNKL